MSTQPPLTEQQIIDSVKNASKENVDNITYSSFQTPPEIQIPIGDKPGQTPVVTPPQPQVIAPQPQTPPAPDTLAKELEDLEREIDGANIEENRTPQSQSAFKALKTRYKNKITEAKQFLGTFQTEKGALVSEIENLKKQVEGLDQIKADAERAKQLEEDLTAAKKESETLHYFRRKYDLENDPEIRREYIEPLQDIEKRSLDIIENAGLDKDFWNSLLSQDSEFKINSLIDNNGFTGLNASTLKNNLIAYKSINSEFKQVSSPEYIDSAINAAHGRSQQVSEETRKQIFDNLKTTFSAHVKELREHPLNKEHNIFVYDKVIDKAQKSYDDFCKSLGPVYQNKNAINVMGHAALMTAAYPFQAKLVDYLIKENSTLKTALEEASSGPGIKQTREQKNGVTSFSDMIQEAKSNAGKTLEQIARESQFKP